MNPSVVTALVPIITQGVTLVRSQAENQTMRHGQLAELAVLHQRMKLEMERLEHRRIIAAGQREMFEKMLSVSGEVTAQKIDVIVEMFREVMAFLREHQKGLLREKERLSEQYFSVDALTQAQVNNRQLEIDKALGAIDECALRVQAGATSTIAALDPSCSPLALGWS